jgi:hypothetical protein
LNRESERNPRSLLRGQRANRKQGPIPYGAAQHCRQAEHSPLLAAGSFNFSKIVLWLISQEMVYAG